MRRFTLENGLTVILDPFEHRAVAAAFGCHGGYRYDPEDFPGESHAFEHPAARATKAHPSWALFARFYERFTPLLNAETGATVIMFSPESIRRRAREIIRLLAEAVQQPLLAADEIRHEYERLREERGDEADSTPSSMDADFFSTLGIAWKDKLPDLPAAKIAERLRSLHRRLLVGENAILVVAGGFDPDRIEGIVRESFASLRQGKRQALRTVDYQSIHGRVIIRRNTSDRKVTFLVGFPTPGFADPDRVAIGVLRNHLSARISSRFGIRLDSVGRGYSSDHDLMFWHDLGYFIPVNVSLFPGKLAETLAIVSEELSRARTELITADDLNLARENLKVRAGLRFSSPGYVARFYCEQWINLGEVIPLRQYLRLLNAVTRHAVRRAARRVFVNRRRIVVVHGALPKSITKKDIRHALRWRG